MSSAYPPPVYELPTYAKPEPGEWPDYLELGLAPEHVPELIRMATDEPLNEGDEDRPEIWAPVHAWRALGQLRAVGAIEPLLALLKDLEDDDWASEEIPEAIGMIGPPAIGPVAAYLATAAHGTDSRILASRCLERIGTLHPEARDACVAALMRQLERYAFNDPELNGFLISSLIDLRAVEALPVIQAAYEKARVETWIVGDLEDVEIELGLRQERATPAHYSGIREPFFPDLDERLVAQVGAKKQKVGRNDPCPCGSGKKYKKCCLNK